jgi:hypothetical protein
MSCLGISPNKNVKIRIATKEEAPDIAKIHVEAWRSAYEEIMPAEYLEPLSIKARTAEWFEVLFTTSPGINIVIELEHAKSGLYLKVEMINKESVIQELKFDDITGKHLTARQEH